MKRIISIVLTCILCFLFSTSSCSSEWIQFGDANGDGKINARDVIMIMKYMVGDDVQIYLDAANVFRPSDDQYENIINARDIIMLMEFLCGYTQIELGARLSRRSPESFSSNILEPREHAITDIKRAVLYKYGAEVVIENDDPRLIRMINFITFAVEDEEYAGAVQGYLEKEDFDLAREQPFRMEIEIAETNECLIFPNPVDLVIVFGQSVFQWWSKEVELEIVNYNHFFSEYKPYWNEYYNILEYFDF